MSEDSNLTDPPHGPGPEQPAPPQDAHPPDLQDRLRSIAARLRDAAQDLGSEMMIDIPSRLGDHSGLLIAVANELEELIK